MARLAFPNALAELVGMTDAVTSSDLDWTITRITSPNDRPATGTIRSGFLGRDRVGSAMSRAASSFANSPTTPTCTPLPPSATEAPGCRIGEPPAMQPPRRPAQPGRSRSADR